MPDDPQWVVRCLLTIELVISMAIHMIFNLQLENVVIDAVRAHELQKALDSIILRGCHHLL
jgi:hypothetical protein